MNARFESPLRLEDVDGETFVVLEPLRFYSAKHDATFIAPAGYRTDLASIPRGLWNVFPKTGKYDRAAVIHDAGYTKSLVSALGRPVALIKSQVDALFLEAMLADGVEPGRARLMYLAVRMFGRMEEKNADASNSTR